jgi:hypothetical protein
VPFHLVCFPGFVKPIEKGEHVFGFAGEEEKGSRKGE